MEPPTVTKIISPGGKAFNPLNKEFYYLPWFFPLPFLNSFQVRLSKENWVL
jgi:hypothetical protein